ncbi:MAG: hypothetical protein H6698_01520 [Myxococcales bacterium]|nr:hypothetical protein [Myxococcales bacterium]MCB9532989.1 hypothetical protein [Myxococcales bacterium]
MRESRRGDGVPVGGVAALALLIALVARVVEGPHVDQLVRFAAVCSIAAATWGALRVGAAAGAAIAPPRWRVVPLPFFDDELAPGRLDLARGSGARRVGWAAASWVAAGAGLAIAWSLVPAARGELLIGEGARVETFRDVELGADRYLGAEVGLANLDASDGRWSGTLQARDASGRAGPPVLVAEGGSVRIGPWAAKFVGLDVADAIGGAAVDVTVRATGESVSAYLTRDQPVEVGGVALTLLDADLARQEVFGPAVRVRIASGRDLEDVWLHGRASDLHLRHGGGAIGLTLRRLDPEVSAVFAVSGWSAVGAALPWASLGWLLSGAALLLLARSRGVFVTGRSGDYRLWVSPLAIALSDEAAVASLVAPRDGDALVRSWREAVAATRAA